MIKLYSTAQQLPADWQFIFKERVYMAPNLLHLLETVNPCQQQYAIINRRSAFIIYQLKLNAFTYAKWRYDLTLAVIGMPCSVASSAYLVQAEDRQVLIDFLKRRKQHVIIINSDTAHMGKPFIDGTTLPTCLFHNRWVSFDDYLSGLRSHYRYRAQKALTKGRGLTITQLSDNAAFSAQHYALYEQVYQRSQFKLEKLSIGFFKKMPCQIYVFEQANTPVAFVQLLHTERTLHFVFGGMDYHALKTYDLYYNMLLFIIKTGIELGVSQIDMGQTAETSKMRLGCILVKKHMHLYVANPLLKLLIKPFANQLCYQLPDVQYQPFKEI